MINSSEIRIGSLIHSDLLDTNSRVTGFLQHRFLYTDLQESYSELEDWSPIPLTPEILEKFGFQNIHAEHSEHFKKDNILIEIIPDDTIHARLEYGTQSLFLTELKSLHQLQNLYFALTNQELRCI